MQMWRNLSDNVTYKDLKHSMTKIEKDKILRQSPFDACLSIMRGGSNHNHGATTSRLVIILLEGQIGPNIIYLFTIFQYNTELFEVNVIISICVVVQLTIPLQLCRWMNDTTVSSLTIHYCHY